MIRVASAANSEQSCGESFADALFVSAWGPAAVADEQVCPRGELEQRPRSSGCLVLAEFAVSNCQDLWIKIFLLCKHAVAYHYR